MTLTQQFVSTAEPEPVPGAVPGHDESSARLLGLLGELDRVGLAGELSESRALLARAGEVARAHGTGQAAVDALRDRLVAGVAAGELELAAAASQLAAADSAQVSGDLMQAAVRSLRGQAVAAARADGMAVHGALADRVADAVRVAVDAGRQLVDVKAVARLLTPPAAASRGPQHGPSPTVHPWVDAPPSLPVVTLETFAGDRALVTAWAESSAASQEIGRLFEVARALHAVWGNSSRLYAVERDSNVVYFYNQLAEPVQLAVADALGWKPGLHLSLKPGAPEPPRSLMDNIIAGIRYPVGWVVGDKAPRGGPYGGAGRPRS